MIDDEVLVRAAANCAEAYRTWVAGLGRPWRAWDDLLVADMGLPVPLPPNHAALRTPLADADVDDLIERMAGFFGASAGGDYQLWSLWPTPDLSRFGFVPWGVPLMIRDAGGEEKPAPPELDVTEVDDDASAKAASSVLVAFGTPASAAESLIIPGLRSETFRFWLGRVNGEPASIAAASVSHGFVGVYAVATLPEHRGRGFGEALSWAATRFRAELPATLQASPMGRPVYERMGFRTVATFHAWNAPRR